MKKVYVILLCAFLLSSCAQVVLPKGGPKDVTPPKVVSYLPENKSTLVHAKKIDITFDEYIQLKDLSKQFIVSPPLKRLPVPLIKGRVLEIPLSKDTLMDSTTYTFNFGNAVCDLNEGNPLKNFQYVFSTGTYVDSLSVTGKAIDAFTHDFVKEGLVMLYTNLDDSIPYKKNPAYCGQTDDNGNYRIDNIKSGKYRLIAISKGSGDYLYHPYSQSIGFKSGTLTLNKNDTVNFFMFMEEQPKLQFSKAKALGKGQIMLVFNKPADSVRIAPTNIDTSKTATSLYQYSATHDTLTYWTNYPDLDSLRFIIYHNNKALDTAIVYGIMGGKHITSTKKNKKTEKPPVLQVGLNIASNTPYDYHIPFAVQFPHPVTKYDFSKIKLVQRNDTIPLKSVSKASLYNLSLSPEKDLISDSAYSLRIMPGAFTDLFGYINDTIIAPFKVEEESYYGTFKLNLTFSNKSHYLIQLLTPPNNVYRQDTAQNNKSIFYDGLPPASYGIRVIEDGNNNGKWDGGNYLKNTEPEKVFYFPDKINIRSNWDLSQELESKLAKPTNPPSSAVLHLNYTFLMQVCIFNIVQCTLEITLKYNLISKNI